MATRRLAGRVGRDDRMQSPFAAWRLADTAIDPSDDVARGGGIDDADNDDSGDDRFGSTVTPSHSYNHRPRQRDPHPRELAQFVLPPLALDEAPHPDGGHLDWRFKHARSLWGDATPEQLELVRLQHTLRVPGRWSEIGQSDPTELDPGLRKDSSKDGEEGGKKSFNDDPVVAAREAFLAESAGGGRVPTASELLKGKEAAQQKKAGGSGRPDPSSAASGGAAGTDASPLPWIDFDWKGSEEAHMQLLWRLARLRVDVGGHEDGAAAAAVAASTSAMDGRHRGLPQSITAAAVPEFWAAEYGSMRSLIHERKASITERLGVRRVGRGYRFEQQQHEAAASVLNRNLSHAHAVS
jgi:hypothetical protein